MSGNDNADDAIENVSTESSQASAPIPPSPGKIREELLNQAVSFLRSPSVETADKNKKIAFLEKKGLNQQEIDEAFKRIDSGELKSQQPQSSAGPPPPVPSRLTVQMLYSPPSPTTPSMTASHILTTAIFCGAASVSVIAGLLGVVKHTLSTTHSSIADYRRDRYNQQHTRVEQLQQSLVEMTSSQSVMQEHLKLAERLDRVVEKAKERTEVNDSSAQFRDSIFDLRKLVTSQYYSYPSYGTSYGYLNQANKDDEAVQKFKEEIRSLKGMLLSRRNFPQASTDRTPVPVAPNYLNHPRRRRSNHTET